MAKHIHFIEIAGNTMSGLAMAAKAQGNTVTGTDENAYPPTTDYLDKAGITWWREASPEHVQGADLVVISGAYPATHPEIMAAQKANILVQPFAQFWGELISNDYSIVVSGTHGKTTTSALLTWILEVADKHPDYLIGVRPKDLETSVRFNASSVAVSEGDEYQASQLAPTSKFSFYHPDMLVVTSVEMDHPDLFKDLDDLEKRFADLVSSLAPDAKLFLCADDPGAAKLSAAAKCDLATYGFNGGDWRASAVHFSATGISFTLAKGPQELGEITVGLFGRHNILNALGAVAAASTYGADWSQIVKAAASFKGTARRFSILTPTAANVRVIDDYAHHPTAARATIEAAKLHFHGRVIAVYQPHTYSRTKSLLKEYQQAFIGADATFLLPVDGARERHLEATVSSEDIAAKAMGKVEVIKDREELVGAVLGAAQPGDTVLVMTVTGYNELAEELAEKLQGKFK